jgi:hypothetical protein
VALDEVLASALDLEQQDSREAILSIQEGFSDWQVGRTRPLKESFEALRQKHGIPD